MSMKLRMLTIMACLAIIVSGDPVVAQRQGRGRQRAETPRQGAPGRMNQADPEAVRERMTQRLQQRLGVSDAEWQVIQPRLQKVTELSRQLESSGRARRAPGAGTRAANQDRQARRDRAQRSDLNANRETTALGRATGELRELLATDTATLEAINAKLAALRQARQALKQELTQARAQLQQTLTLKQEATLVLMGILE